MKFRAVTIESYVLKGKRGDKVWCAAWRRPSTPIGAPPGAHSWSELCVQCPVKKLQPTADLATLSEGCRSLPRRDLKDEPADVCTLRAAVNMLFVSVFAVRTVRLDARQAHDGASAVRAFPVIEIR